MASAVTQRGDGFRFGDGSVVFPQHEHRIGVAGKFCSESQHVAVSIDGGRRRTGSVNPDANDGLPLRLTQCGDGFAHRNRHRFDVVHRVMAELVCHGFIEAPF